MAVRCDRESRAQEDLQGKGIYRRTFTPQGSEVGEGRAVGFAEGMGLFRAEGAERKMDIRCLPTCPGLRAGRCSSRHMKMWMGNWDNLLQIPKKGEECPC